MMIISKVVTLTATGVNLLYTQQERVMMKLTKIELLIASDDEHDEISTVIHWVSQTDSVQLLDYRNSDVTTEGWN